VRDGPGGRAASTVRKNTHAPAPVLAVTGPRNLRELTAADLRRALPKMAA
jgi:hypothetical protein